MISIYDLEEKYPDIYYKYKEHWDSVMAQDKYMTTVCNRFRNSKLNLLVISAVALAIISLIQTIYSFFI